MTSFVCNAGRGTCEGVFFYLNLSLNHNLKIMKKITLSIIAVVTFVSSVIGQVNQTAIAPPFSNANTPFRAPNGTSAHTLMRGCFLVQPFELANLSLNALISSFSFSLINGNASVATPGSFTLYLQNTPNTTYQKGTIWSGILTGMQQVYSGGMTVPVAASATTITLPITPNFSYGGGGLYVAYDWVSSGPFDATGATYSANNALANGGCSGDSPAAPSPTNLAMTNFRPVYIFDATNSLTNEMQVKKIMGPGKVAKLFNTGHVISAEVRNLSTGTLNNVNVTLNVGGANSFSDVQVISSLGAGATTTVNFNPFNPQTNGVNTVSVSVAPDQNIANNLMTWTQSVTCNVYGVNPPTGTYTSGVGFGTGSGIIANQYIPAVNTDIQSVRIAMSNNTAAFGRSVYGVLLDISGSIQATTNTITISAAMAGNFQNLTFTPAQPLTGGNNYFVGLAQPAVANATYYPLGSQATNLLPDDLYYTFPIGGGPGNQLTNNLGFFGIEPVFSFTNMIISASATKTMICKGESITISASGGSNTFTWSANANAAPNASSSVVSPTLNSITYTVMGTETSSGCRSNVASITVSTSICTGLMVGGVSGSEIKAFPNPAIGGKTTLTGLNGTNKIMVFNLLGQSVSVQSTAEESAVIDLTGQPNGTYLVKITDESNLSKTVKIVNQN
jgi:hypothetical protein